MLFSRVSAEVFLARLISKAAADVGVTGVTGVTGVNSHSLFNAYETHFASSHGDPSQISTKKPVTIPGADGKPKTFIPPSVASVGTTIASVASGGTVLPGIKVPPSMAPPPVSAIPPKTAPVGYKPGTVATPTPKPLTAPSTNNR